MQSEEELKVKVLKGKFYPRVMDAYTGSHKGTFKSGISFSYWEKLGGANRMINADSAIKGRYWVSTKGGGVSNTVVVENGKVIHDMPEKRDALPEEYVNGLAKLINDYESVRNLDHFDPNHCPIIEFQTIDRQNYFLQYHRTRDFKQSTFTLDRPKQDGEIEAMVVRGATSSEGCVVNATLIYAGWVCKDLFSNYEKWELPIEEASFDRHYNMAIWEIMSRRRKVQFMEVYSLDWLLFEIAVGHKSRSHLFKPEVSIVAPKRKLYSEEEAKVLHNKAKETRQDQSIPIYVISDGRKAYVKRV